MTREKNNCSNHTHQHPMETPRHHLHSGSPLFHLSGGHIFETHLPLGSFIYTAAGHWSSFAGGPQQYWPCFRWDAMRWRLRWMWWMWWRRRRWQPGISSLSSFSSLSLPPESPSPRRCASFSQLSCDASWTSLMNNFTGYHMIIIW